MGRSGSVSKVRLITPPANWRTPVDPSQRWPCSCKNIRSHKQTLLGGDIHNLYIRPGGGAGVTADGAPADVLCVSPECCASRTPDAGSDCDSGMLMGQSSSLAPNRPAAPRNFSSYLYGLPPWDLRARAAGMPIAVSDSGAGSVPIRGCELYRYHSWAQG